jgi:uncharacterized lipoprotein
MIRTFNLIITSFLLVAVLGMLAGCAGRDRQPIYIDSEELDPIEAPPGLSQPPSRSTFEVPGYFLPELAAQGSQRPPRVQPSAEAERSRSHIRFGGAGLFLEVQDEPESVWRRLGFALNRDGMRVEEVDDSQQRYRFRFTHEPIEIERTGLSRLAFWRSREVNDYSGVYRIKVREGGEDAAEVILLGANGEILEMEQAEFVLARLRDRLG